MEAEAVRNANTDRVVSIVENTRGCGDTHVCIEVNSPMHPLDGMAQS